MKTRLYAFVIACAAVAVAPAAHHGTGRTDTRAAAGPQGYRVYIDPATNAIVSEPNGTSPVVLDPEMKNALSTSAEGLHEVASPVAGGGQMIDLQGRFQNTMMATIDADGRLVATCVSGLPGSDDAHDAATEEAK